ncbi:MAG TPA: BolA family transcriptional regulator [Gallionella sp.]|jgi:BolA protein|nr:MAG: BolA family protein [Gallionellales bacterium GWA2_54_124]OGT18109.1 MAG: BolA family protein [Gallionellales bacterium RIFOXYD12_FULL_53_10]HCI51885.1 BolA family transcriptional regulator [Gallionella sp.]
MSRIEKMKARLASLNPTFVNIVDESHKHAGHAGAQSGGGHYLLQIVTHKFAGKGTLARHRMIYSALGEMMKTDIHALNIQASTPDEI